jgi:hypothetical protein
MGVLDTVGGLLPLPIGGGAAVAVPPADVDLLVDNIPFWLQISDQNPYQRETADYQKQQVDQANEAGEQSLSGWWLRSQMSFHGGAGQQYLDTTGNPGPLDRQRFWTSYNIDCWTPGVIRRLNGTSVAHATGAGEQLWIAPTAAGVVVARPSMIEVFDGASWTEIAYGSPFPIRAFTSDGTSWYAATIDGVYTGDLAGTAAGTKLYALDSSDVPMSLGWVKQRVMFGHGRDVYVLDGVGAPTLPAALMTHPKPDWAWTAWCEITSGILGAGAGGLSSAAYKFDEDTSSGAPVLQPGAALCDMPPGELINDAYFYMGSFIIFATSRGVRVASIQSYYGTVSLGPLTIVNQGPCYCLGAYDRFVFAGGSGTLYRIDMGTQVDQAGHFAWAPDLPLPAGPVTAIAFTLDGLKWVGVEGAGAVLESGAPDPAADAWLQTSRIRMSTVEDKHWVWASLRGSYGDDDPITVSVQTPGSAWMQAHQATVNTQRFTLTVAKGEWIAFQFAPAGAAELNTYQVNALPGGPRQRLVSLPIRVYDFEKTRGHADVGYRGWALERLDALEHLEGTGEQVTVICPPLFPDAIQGVIEKITFIQRDDPADRAPTTGGEAQLVIRTTA